MFVEPYYSRCNWNVFSASYEC